MDGPVGRGFDSPHLHIVVLFLLQLYKTGRHFFYSLYINKLHKLKICEILSLPLLFTILKTFFIQLQTMQGTILPRSVSIFREMIKGTEKNFIVPTSISEYMPLSGIFIQRASTISAASDLPFVHIKSAVGLATFRTYIPGRLRFIKWTTTIPAVGGFEIKQRKVFPAMRTPVVSKHDISKPEECKNSDNKQRVVLSPCTRATNDENQRQCTWC